MVKLTNVNAIIVSHGHYYYYWYYLALIPTISVQAIVAKAIFYRGRRSLLLAIKYLGYS